MGRVTVTGAEEEVGRVRGCRLMVRYGVLEKPGAPGRERTGLSIRKLGSKAQKQLCYLFKVTELVVVEPGSDRK